MPLTDPKGVEVKIDSLVQGFVGNTKRVASGRVFSISHYGWVAFYDAEHQKQWISYEGKYLVRENPRPPLQRKDIPEKLQAR